MAEGVRLGDVRATNANGDNLLDLVVQVRCLGRIWHVRSAGDERVGGLGEEKRRLTIRVVPHLPSVGRVVAADAEDAADGECAATDDGHRNGGKWRNDGFCHARLLERRKPA